MADSGGFFGGLAGGFSEQQTNNLAAQKQAALDQNNIQVAGQKQIDATLTQIKETADAAAAAGHDPKTIMPVVAPLVAQAQGIAAKIGQDPARVAQMAQAIVSRPPVNDTTKPMAVRPGDTLVHPTTGKVVYQAPSLDPITGRPAAQPALGPSDTLSPAQIATANAPAQQPAPVATPVQKVAMRFPDETGVTTPVAPTGPALPPGMQPGGPAVDYAVKNHIYGQEFLKALPPRARVTTEGILDYKVDPNKLSKRIDKNDGQSEYTRFLGFAHQASEGKYDPMYYSTMQASKKEFTTGGINSPASQIQAGSKAIAHGGEVADAIDEMQKVPGLNEKIAKADLPILSYMAREASNKAVAGTSEGRAVAAFDTAINHFIDESTKFYAQGQTHEAAKERMLKIFNRANSPVELYSSLKKETLLMQGALGALQDRFKNAQAGPRYNDQLFRSSIPDFPVLSEKAERGLERISNGYFALTAKEKAGNPGAPNPDVDRLKSKYGLD